MSILTQGGVVEMIHGIEVRDPYRWLEERDLPQTQEWLKQQERICAQYFSQSGSYRSLRSLVTATLSVEVIDEIADSGESILLRKQLADQEKAAIWVRHGRERQDRLLVDPARIGSTAAVSMLRVSPDGSLLAYGISSSGSDAIEVGIVDIERGETLPDHLSRGYLRGFEFDSKGHGFYYCTEVDDGSRQRVIRYHRLGTSQSQDTTLFSVPWARHRQMTLLARGGLLGALVTEVEGTDKVQDLYIATQEAGCWKAVYRGMTGKRYPILAHGRIFILDMEDALHGRLLELLDATPWRTIVPESAASIQRCRVCREGFIVSYLVDRQPRIDWWTSEGKIIGTLTMPIGGSIYLLPDYSEQSRSVFFMRESYMDAPSIWEVDLSSRRLAEPHRLTRSTEAATPGTVRECWYPSFDGTLIPMTLLDPAIREVQSPRPVILFGYGGFGASELPRYSRLARILLGLGATIARPAIRGGSEFGEEWHRSAIRRKRQTSIDDFLAAASWLISSGITDQGHLAIVGSSNGGLLVAAAVTQRPELFAAAVCTGPLTDMVRYESFDHASRWRREYGTIEDADDFRALLAYSPYHHVRENVEYPAMLFVTGDADDRCNPAHVRKMAAALQNRVAQRKPIIVDYGKSWGHVPTLSLSERTEALNREVAFLCEHLNLALLEMDTCDDLFGA